jgi:ribosomal protein S12 methylthiotransferase
MRQLVASGYTVSHDPEEPCGEIVVVNTCGFTGDAKEESIGVILRFAEARKRKKIKKLFVMGCLSERYMYELKLEIPEVDKFYGKFNWKDLIFDLGKPFYPELQIERILTTPRHYAYLKIAEGCNRACSYCAIPLFTGKFQSRTMDDLEYEVKVLRRLGVKEFQLIAQDLTSYGQDRYGRLCLPELVEMISDIPGVEWIRLHYAHPTHFPYDLLRVMRERKNVCKYLDIALQHINDRTLKRMHRHINKQQTIELIGRIREEVPGIHLRTTMLVGHPGETAAEFRELLDFVRTTRFERLGAFIYSNEELTYAGQNYRDNVSPKVKQRRMDELMTLQEGIAEEVSKEKIGRVMQVMIDREESDFYVGRTEYDSPEVDPEVLVAKNRQLETGRIYPVKITATQSVDLCGKAVRRGFFA